MRKKEIIMGGIVIIVGALVTAYLVVFQPGPDLAAYEYLRQPRITTTPSLKMLVVTAQGDPNVVGSKAFGLLFKTYLRSRVLPGT